MTDVIHEGHSACQIGPPGMRAFIAWCPCGWRGRWPYTNRDDAQAAADQHVQEATVPLISANEGIASTFVNADRTVLVTDWGAGRMTVALRDDTGAIWGPPIKVERE